MIQLTIKALVELLSKFENQEGDLPVVVEGADCEWCNKLEEDAIRVDKSTYIKPVLAISLDYLAEQQETQ